MARIILLSIILLPLKNAIGQAPFELENRKALKLTERRLKVLLSKDWRVVYTETQNRKIQNVKSRSAFRGIQYNPDGTFSSTTISGTWIILEGKFIKHNLKREDEIKMNFGGTYAVTALSDTSLVLTKILTSSQDMKKVIYLNLSGRWGNNTISSAFVPRSLRKLNENQIDSISRLSSEVLFERNFFFTTDTLFYPTIDSLYKIKRKRSD